MRFIAVFLILLLSACGQSGDLYLPSKPAPASEAPPAAPAADVPPAEKSEEEKKPEAERTP
jgi:predicted small lipoprotein YifL